MAATLWRHMFFRRKKRKEAAVEPRTSGEESGEQGATAGPASTQFLTGETNTDGRTVQVLLEAIARVSGSKDLNSLLTDIVDRSIEITGAERGLLLLGGEDGAAMEVHVARRSGRKPVAGEVRFSTSVAGKVLSELQPIRATVHSESEALELGRSVFDLKLRAVMCVPLSSAEGESSRPPSGVLYVDSRAATRQFQQRDLALFAALAQHISIAMENARLHIDSIEKLRLEQSLELASAIQRDLMPEIPTDIDGWEVHGWYGPAEGTAGDFYDFIRQPSGRLAIVVGDVTGHGIGPALITATAQASLRAYMRMLDDLGKVVSLLNQDLCERVEDGRFLTIFLAMLSPDGTVNGLNGGHSLPFIYRKATGEIETIGIGGPALGMIPEENYTTAEPFSTSEGDVLVIYTDGLTEARPADQPENLFGEEGLKKVLVETGAAGVDAKTICIQLVESAMQLSGGIREDDITVVVARRRAQGASA